MPASPPLGPSDYSELGNRFLAARDYEKAGAAFYECLKRAPATIGAALGLAAASRELGKLEMAVKVLETALRFNPQDVRLLVTLGAALQENGEAARAVEILQRAVSLHPESFEASFNLGNALERVSRLADAEAAYRRALAVRPDDSDARTNLVKALMKRGDVLEMERELRRGLETEPGNPTFARLLLFVLAYLPDRSSEEILRFSRLAVDGLAKIAPVPAERPHRGTGQKLRIGVLSGDLRGHPVGRNTLPVLEHLDRTRFDLIFFSDTPKADATTERFRACAAGWLDTARVPDVALAETIRQEKIDILLILAGRFDENRSFFGLHRAAPVQVAMHDVATSALPHIDYLVLDRFIVPRVSRPNFSERVIRLPSFYTHEPIAKAPEVGPLPLIKGRGPTLGCLNNPFKLNERVLTLWARLLREIPGSRLLLSYKDAYASSDCRARILAPFLQGGVDPARVELLSERRGTIDYLGLYNDIDIALDPFPFSGSTTTFEALWMGVPVVTKAGETPASRWTGSMLHTLGLDRLIVATDDEYVAAIQRLIEEPTELAKLRQSLRALLCGSPLCSGSLRAGQMARLLRTARTRGSCE